MSHCVVVEGNTLPEFDTADVRTSLARLIGQSEAVAAKLLAGTPRNVKSNVDHVTGLRYVEALRAIGVACHLEGAVLPLDLNEQPHLPSPVPPSAAPPSARAPGLNERFCSACGSIVHKQAELCPSCGVRLREHVAETPPVVQMISSGRSRGIAALLAIFLGGIGVHKFYLGKASGIWYLLFCWTIVPAIIGLFEGFGYLFMSDGDFARKHGGTTAGNVTQVTTRSSGGRAMLLLGAFVVLGVAASAMIGRSRAPTEPQPAVTAPSGKVPVNPSALASVLKPIIPISRTKASTLGHIETRIGIIEVSGQYAPGTDKVVTIFTPGIPLDNDAPRFFPELVELIYGVRPSSSMHETRDGTQLILGDSPKQFMLLHVKDGNRVVGAVLQPRS